MDAYIASDNVETSMFTVRLYCVILTSAPVGGNAATASSRGNPWLLGSFTEWRTGADSIKLRRRHALFAFFADYSVP